MDSEARSSYILEAYNPKNLVQREKVIKPHGIPWLVILLLTKLD
jgi:hypothetical protein